METGVPGLQNDKAVAGDVESKQSAVRGQVLPLRPDFADEYRAARPVRGFMAAELILR